MESGDMKKKSWFKNIFYIIFAFCFLSLGVISMNTTHQGQAMAEETEGQEIVNEDIPEYFAVEEYLNDSPVNAFIESNIFAYTEGSSLSLSLKHSESSAMHDIYNYVYYPNEGDETTFYFYVISSIGLTYNGVAQNITQGDYITKCGAFFPGQANVYPDLFTMVFDTHGTDNHIKVLDDDGNVKEGVYNIAISYMLVRCTDGTNDMSEREFQSLPVAEINYSFYLVDKTNYLTNNMPNTTRTNFDHEIQSNGDPLYDFYLYSNHSGKNNLHEDGKLPYIEYDYTRYEVSVNRELANLSYSQNFLYDLDSSAVVSDGDDFANYVYDTTTHMAKLYFTELGNYAVTYKDILLVDNAGTMEKHYLTGLANYTKKCMVYMFGYQANYTDMDEAPDANNNRPVKELKSFNFDAGVFYDSADITSAFLNSNDNYSQDNTDSTFLISNVANFINNNNIAPVKTNQTPINFSSNAFLSTIRKSYIYTTNNLGWDAISTATLGGKTLYRSTFTGQAEGTTGTYIYIVAYTFNNYRISASTQAPDKIFYQVFYFEINKDIPTISIKTTNDVDGADVGTFTNSAVYVFDTTKDNPYNKDVQIRIYAKSFAGNFLSAYGGTNGVTFDSLLQQGASSVVLDTSAHYTIRLYYANQVNNANTSYYSSKFKIREASFTIDKDEISEIRGTNVSAIVNSSNYSVVSNMTNFATNQNFAISWDRKASGADTYAYYRYFKIDAKQFYNRANDGIYLSALITQLFGRKVANTNFLPIEYTLDMSTESNDWQRYYDNAIDAVDSGVVATDYVFSDGGLYLVDVYDEAGNHRVQVFLLDYTTPLFALYDVASRTYTLPNKSCYISHNSEIHWADYKCMYVTNLTNDSPFVTMTPQMVAEHPELLPNDNLYTDFNGNERSLDIYTALYTTLKGNYYLYDFTINDIPTGQSGEGAITRYSGLYLTIPLEDTYYYLNENNIYEKRTGASKETITITDKEMSYSILIRDTSNTKAVTGMEGSDAIQNYTQYYSAIQKATVSFDSSQFKIGYTNGSGEFEDLTQLTNSKETTGELPNPNKTNPDAPDYVEVSKKITYLNPTNLNKAFTISFTPTQSEEGATIQVDSVVVKYYAYKRAWETKLVNDEEVKFSYYTLDANPTEITIYSYNGEPTIDEVTEYIKLNSDGYTAPGKYEITRTYSIASGFTHNDTDFVIRTFVFYVDRNEVISNPELIDDAEKTHLESLVGGDIFVAMYDNGTNSNLVVTFPDSATGNQESSSLYNSGTNRSVLTTNMLPVRIYVPRYKYTKSASMVEDSNGYHYHVDFDEDTNVYDKIENNKTINEYNLYASLFKDSMTNLYARTSVGNLASDFSNISVNADGFLVFRRISDNSIINLLTEPGTYYVEILQGATSDSFTQSIVFSFEIKKTDPDFVAQTESGTELISTIQTGSKVKEVYYTNQPIVQLIWEKGSNYIAEIDRDNIKFETSTGFTFNAASCWHKDPVASNNTWIATMNLETLNMFRNGEYVDITMQYQNHTAGLYNTITKRIFVDLSAPYANINTLVDNATAPNIISGLTPNALRMHIKYDKESRASSLTETCYNLSDPGGAFASGSSGNFAYYSYYVTADYLTTLKNSQDYKTYVREFANKYVTGVEQETSPADFMNSKTKFTEIDELAEFSPNKYYEIVETDRAGNLTIYTIYVADVDADREILSYTSQAEGAYDTEDYNLRKTYADATHNIYSKTGFTLTDIDYFGDAWAQFTLTKVEQRSATINGETRNTMQYVVLYLMMTPWDTEHVYAFANGIATPINITDLIDGSLNSIYKNELNFYNRKTLSNEKFYINTRNTDLKASLTDVQEQEYIKFNIPTDSEINNSTYSSTYLTSLKITADNTILYDQTNELGYASLWESRGSVTCTYDAVAGQIKFALATTFAPNTKVIYEYTNNYGTSYKEIHLYRETIIAKEVTSIDYLYGYYMPNGNLYYITQNDLQYNYNPAKYSVAVYDYENATKSEEETERIQLIETSSTGGIRVLTLHQVDPGPYFNTFVIEVKDVNDDIVVKSIYFTLYNELPVKNLANTPNEAGQFKLLDASRNNITERITSSLPAEERGYFSEVTLLYAQADTLIPIVYSYSLDKENWTEVQSGKIFKNTSEEMVTYYIKVWYDEAYIENEIGSARYLFENVPSEQIYEFNLSSLTSTYWIEKTIDGVTTIVEKSGTIYKTIDGKQYSNHYIVNIPISSKSAIQIKTNEEQGIVVSSPERLDDGTGSVASERYLISASGLSSLSNFSTYIVITYIPTTDTPVAEFFTYDSTGTINETNLISQTSTDYIAPTSSSISKIELQWSKYNGIEYNEIKIALAKDGVTIIPTIYTRKSNGKSYNYCYLTYSGKYTISLYDISGNIQKFNYQNAGQSEIFTLNFFKDVPFTIEYTDVTTGQSKFSLPLKQAIYNGAVSICIDNSTLSQYPDGHKPQLKISRNGTLLNENSYEVSVGEDGKTRYTISQTGYYEYSFINAVYKQKSAEIREETYQFTIVNANEYKYSYMLNKYANYYVEKVVRNGKDITSKLVESLDVSKIRVNQQEYLAELPLSYLSEITGEGIYLITVNSNEKYFTSETWPTSWTYQIIIQVGSAPIKVSIAQGGSTTKAISVVYNSANIYQEMGECTIQIVRYNKDGSYSGVAFRRYIDETTTDKVTTSIDKSEYGIYYVQLLSPGGTMLYSYKVVKQEPMNAASIIAIVISVLVFVAIVVIVYRLRKRISVK